MLLFSSIAIMGIASAAGAAEAEQTAIVLRWEKIPAAVGYLVEIAQDKNFQTVVVKERVDSAYFRWFAVARRDYYWRVRGIDATGREGQLSEPALIAREVLPPRLLAPREDLRLAFAIDPVPVTLKWESSDVIKEYIVELARDQAFADTIESARVTGTSHAFQLSGLGDYYWHVIGIDLNDQPTSPSPPRHLSLIVELAKSQQPHAGANHEGPGLAPTLSQHLEVAPTLGFIYNFGKVFAPRIGALASYRLTLFDRPLDLALAVSMYASSTSKQDTASTISFTSRLTVVPIEVTAVYILPMTVVDLQLGAGLSIDMTQLQTRVTGEPELGQHHVNVGAVAIAGAERRIGKGRVFGQLSFALTTRTRESLGQYNPGGLGIVLGYRLGVW